MKWFLDKPDVPPNTLNEPQLSQAMPPLEYLLGCSEMSLQDLELAALSRSANCLKAARLEWDEAIAQREIAGVARWLRDNRSRLLEIFGRTIDAKQFPPGGADEQGTPSGTPPAKRGESWRASGPPSFPPAKK